MVAENRGTGRAGRGSIPKKLMEVYQRECLRCTKPTANGRQICNRCLTRQEVEDRRRGHQENE